MNMGQEQNFDAWPTVVTAIFLCSLGPVFFLIQPIYVGTLADQVGFNPQQIGWISGAEFSGTAIASIAGFFLLRRLDWQKIATIALLLQAIGNILSGYSNSFVELLLLRFLTATLGMAPLYVLSIAVLSNTSRASRNFALVVFGQMLIAIVGLALLPNFTPRYGLATLFYPVAFIGLMALTLLSFVPKGSGRDADASQPSEATLTAFVPAAGVLLVQLIWYTGVGGVWAFVERVGVAGGMAPTDVGDALATGMAVGLVGALSAGYLTEKRGFILPFLVGMLSQTVAIGLLLQNVTPATYLISVCLYNFMWNLCLPPIFGLIVAVDSTNRFSVLLPTCQSLGIVVGSVVGGTLAKTQGLPVVMLVGIALTLVALGVYLWIARQVGRSY